MRQRDTILIVDDMEINRVILDGLFQEEYHLLRLSVGSRPLLATAISFFREAAA